MEGIKLLFHKVRGVGASCRMDQKQTLDYERLNNLYNTLSKTNVKHSICAKKVLLNKVESFIYAANS